MFCLCGLLFATGGIGEEIEWEIDYFVGGGH
jgi:hypothetical protein